MDGGAWQATVHVITKGQAWLGSFTFTSVSITHYLSLGHSCPHWVQLTGTEVCSQQHRLSLTKATTEHLVCHSKYWISGRISYSTVIGELPDGNLITLGLFHTGQAAFYSNRNIQSLDTNLPSPCIILLTKLSSVDLLNVLILHIKLLLISGQTSKQIKYSSCPMLMELIDFAMFRTILKYHPCLISWWNHLLKPEW